MAEGVFSLIPEDSLKEILGSLQSFTGLPISLTDKSGAVLISFSEGSGYCSLLNRAGIPENTCMSEHARAAEMALHIGEAYIFSCHAGLNHIAFPLIHRHELLASVLIGPFLMDSPDSTIVSAAAEKYPLQPSVLLDLYDELSGIAVLSPAKVNDLKKLLEHLLLPLMPAERAMLKDRQEKLYQQSKINETIQMYKGEKAAASAALPIELERQLLSKAKTGDIQETKRILNEILGQVLFSEGGALESVRRRAVELTTLLSRVAADSGARSDTMLRLTGLYYERISSADGIEDICFLLQEILESFMDAMSYRRDSGNMHIRAAIQFIASNYSRHISLADAAEAARLSESYFSSLFRSTVGIPFSEYLNRVRVEESRQLLLSTDYSLAEIAVAVGFPDQSYFCKVFRKVTGLTPGSYRN